MYASITLVLVGGGGGNGRLSAGTVAAFRTEGDSSRMEIEDMGESYVIARSVVAVRALEMEDRLKASSQNFSNSLLTCRASSRHIVVPTLTGRVVDVPRRPRVGGRRSVDDRPVASDPVRGTDRTVGRCSALDWAPCRAGGCSAVMALRMWTKLTPRL